MKQFKEKIYAATRRIPRGRVATYKAVARAAARPRAYRAVGNILNVNPHAPKVPCHRVVRSDGLIGGYASGPGRKIAILRKEGVAVKRGRIDLEKFGFSF